MSRAIASHFHSMSADVVSRSLSAPMTRATSNAPEATPNSALRTASLPVAQEFSTRVTGNSGSPSESARMPDGKPSAVPIAPNHAPCTSVFIRPLSTLLAHLANAIGSRSLMPRAKCSPNAVMPAPTIATFLMPRLPLAPVLAALRSSLALAFGSSCGHRPIRLEHVPVVRHSRAHGDAAQRQSATVADVHCSRLRTGHLDQSADADTVEFDDHQRVWRPQPGHRHMDGGFGVDGSGARQRDQLVVGGQRAVVS